MMSKTKEDEEPLSVQEIIALPDVIPSGRVCNYINIEKRHPNGKILRLTLSVYCEERSAGSSRIRVEQLPLRRSLPPDTPLSLGAYRKPPSILGLDQIFGLLREEQSSFLYFRNEIEYDILTLFTITSYFREVFRTFGFITFRSPDRGDGKTTATKVTIYGGYNGLFTTNPLQAAFYRMVEDSGCIVGIDQLDDVFRNQDNRADLLALFDAAHQKGAYVYRCEADPKATGRITVRPFDAFAPMAYNGVRRIPISLLSRSIVITMEECAGRKRLRKYPIPQDFRVIRDLLYFWRIRNWRQVQAVYEQLVEEEALLDRGADVYLPLLTIAKTISEDLYNRVLEYAKKKYAEQREERIDSTIQALVKVLQNHIGVSEVSAITASLNELLKDRDEQWRNRDGEGKLVSPQWVGYKLKMMGFEKTGRSGSGRMCYTIDPIRVDVVAERYQVDIPEKSSDSSESSGRTLLSHAEVSLALTEGQEKPSPVSDGKTGKSEDSEHSEGFPGVSGTGEELPEQQERIARLLGYMRMVAAPNGHIEVVRLHKYCLDEGWKGYTHGNLDADLEHLRTLDKIIEVHEGVYRLL